MALTPMSEVEVGDRVVIRPEGEGDLEVGKVLEWGMIRTKNGRNETILRVKLKGWAQADWFGEGEFIGKLAVGAQ